MLLKKQKLSRLVARSINKTNPNLNYGKMKKTNKIIAISLLSIFGFTQTACMGSFNLTNGIYDWNEGATSSKIGNNIIFWAFVIVPVYEIALVLDAIIFNLIEFWSGSNPIAMKEGEVETQFYEKDGVAYEMKATKNNFVVSVLNGEEKGEKLHLQYTPESKSWNKVEASGELVELVKYNEDSKEVTIFKPNGESITVENNMDNFA